MRINSRKAFSIILLSLSLCACSNNGTKNNIQERRHKSPSDFTQIHSAPTNETSILETSTKREAEIFIDEEFCKNLLSPTFGLKAVKPHKINLHNLGRSLQSI